MRIVAAIQLKSYMINANIFEIVISKFGHGQKSGLIILFEIDKYTKIYFYGAMV